ncbi:MAG: bifunctional (p)ppGpp synthetase/guanosine-3',5'-bis(diphosphate) 3'-pyrophosphohydrolase [Alphaproteobacteria bacterium]|nr:bifunctional (p)ppGpp synthetase/guanosine-3',5'-bis(diphosphate) 3'-pyrophosphohydrolase [Alphaproteobacteria bacterium]
MIRQYELVERIKAYDPDVNEDLVNRAYVYAMKMHGSQMRASGDPYFSHPLEVAAILTDMKLDAASICTALLHDTVEDTEATLEEIKKLFGDEIMRLVDGVTKLSKITFQTAQQKQAENFRKLVLAMSEDIRVLLVKLADRLHNMRTLHHIPKPEKQRRIALETVEIYAPLAERIGIHQIKEELEDISFGILNPEARDSITARLNYLRAEGGEAVVARIIGELKKKMSEGGVEAEIYGREKTRYSIWKKMQRKNISFEQLSDIMAFRVIMEDMAGCYHALGVIHGLYPTVPGRFKDYISLPKPNGYRSLHTTVIGPENHRIEVQIRTAEMHEEAELGVAAHWNYKQSGSDKKSDGRQYRWLRELMDIVEQAQKPEEFLENTKLELYQDHVFCFTPQGDLISLPRGATPVDFAYAVHSELGDKTVGAKVNGRIVPLNTQLVNGDQVQVTTSKSQTPSPNWERFVVTGKAKARIRRFIRLQQRAQYMGLGKAMLQKVMKQEGVEYSDKDVTADILKHYKVDAVEDLLTAIGSGHVTARDVLYTVHPDVRKKASATPTLQSINDVASRRGQSQRSSSSAPMPIKGLIPGMALHFARCCHPLPGDSIVGIVMTGKGVTIHTIDCETLESFADTPERWLDVSWDDGADAPETHTGRLMVTIANTPGALGNISTVIGKSGGNITNLKIVNRALDFWDMMIDVYVRDSRHLNDIITALRAAPEIMSVNRARRR